MLIEAAKGGHTNVVQLLLDYPHSVMLNQPNASMLPGEAARRDSPLPTAAISQPLNFFQSPPCISSTGKCILFTMVFEDHVDVEKMLYRCGHINRSLSIIRTYLN